MKSNLENQSSIHSGPYVKEALAVEEKTQPTEVVEIDELDAYELASNIAEQDPIIGTRIYYFLTNNYTRRAALVILTLLGAGAMTLEQAYASFDEIELEVSTQNVDEAGLNQSGTCVPGRSHVIHAGDTIASIAARYHVPEEWIRACNPHIRGNLILGQVLEIPSNYIPAPTPIPYKANGPFQSETSTHRTNTAEQNIGGAYSGGIYTVGSGDTLYAIATRYGTTVRAIMEVNELSNANYIRAGQQLRIPSNVVNQQPVATPIPQQNAVPTALNASSGWSTPTPVVVDQSEIEAAPVEQPTSRAKGSAASCTTLKIVRKETTESPIPGWACYAPTGDWSEAERGRPHDEEGREITKGSKDMECKPEYYAYTMYGYLDLTGKVMRCVIDSHGNVIGYEPTNYTTSTYDITNN